MKPYNEMRKIILATLVAMLMVALPKLSYGQLIEVGDKPVTHRVQLTGGASTLVSPPNIDLNMVFDDGNDLLTIEVVSRTPGGEAVWIPAGGLDRGDMKNYTRSELRMKCKMSRKFKQQIAFGVGQGLVFSNARMDAPAAAVLLCGGEKASYTVKVNNPDSPVEIKLVGLAATQIVESVSGGQSLKYEYVADDVALSVKVKVDPCRLAENQELKVKVEKLNACADSLSEELLIAKNRKDAGACRRIKGIFEDSIQVVYNEYLMSIGRVPQICTNIEDLLEFTADKIRMARMVKSTPTSTTPVTPPPPQTNVITTVNRLRDETHELEVCRDAIRAAQSRGADYSAEASRARAIIARTDGFINGLSPKTGSDSQVVSRKRSYEIVRQSIERLLK